MKRNVILLVNTGTPDAPDRSSVRRYLLEFLNDPRVIDMPWLLRKMLVNLIIVPFRSGKSSQLYKRLWTAEGSPLSVNLERLTAAVRNLTADRYTVIGAMRYGNPSLRKAIRNLEKSGVEKLIVVPLYPQYASSTTGSVNELVMSEISGWNNIPEIHLVGQFCLNPLFIRVFSGLIRSYRPENFDHVLFSYHSLPIKHLDAVHPDNDHQTCACDTVMPEYGGMCYRATCYQTTRLIAGELGLKPGAYSTAFQSRLSGKWLGPHTDKVIRQLAAEGKKRILFAAPSFTADCLETIVEADDYRKLLLKNAGEELTLVESLNSNEEWVKALTEIAGVG